MSHRKSEYQAPANPVDTEGIALLVSELKPEYKRNFDALVSRLFENAQHGKYKSSVTLETARQTVLRLVMLTEGEILR